MSKRNIIIVVIVVIVLVGGYFFFKNRNTVVATPTETVKRGDIIETVSVTGDMVPTEYADLSFSGVGTVDALLVAQGEAVKKDQPIASLDRTILQSQLNEARVGLAIARENEKLARRGWEDLQPEARAAKKLATQQIEESVKTILAQMKKSVLVSPIDGVVTKLDTRVGETVTTGQVIAHVVLGEDFFVEARVPESDIAKVRTGMTAKITFDAFSTSDIFDGEVVEIEPSATVVQNVVSYIVKFRLGTSDDRLKEGMTANIDIETANREGVLVVPFRALFKSAGITYAEVKRGGENNFEKVIVTTGLEGDEGVIEILSGLKEGDEVSIGSKQAN